MARSFLLSGTIWGVTFGTGRGGTKVAPSIVPFSVSVLAAATNRVEAAISEWPQALKSALFD